LEVSAERLPGILLYIVVALWACDYDECKCHKGPHGYVVLTYVPFGNGFSFQVPQ
jgi:hypothetical protein